MAHARSDPENIFRLAGEFGVVGAQKADDMRLQQRSSHHEVKQRIAVATDSGADIPDEIGAMEIAKRLFVTLRPHV